MKLRKGIRTISRAGLPHFSHMHDIQVILGEEFHRYKLPQVEASHIGKRDQNLVGAPECFAITDDKIIFYPKPDTTYKIEATVSEIFQI